MEHATASGTVSLEGMAFFARHGFYEEERKLGNRYEVDIAVETPLHDAATNDELTGTVNYEGLYRIVREEMETPSKLLEHVAGRILERTCREFPAILSVEVSISKFNPPIGGVCERSRVRMNRRLRNAQL
jgi:dihydroneopterin aldolase